MERGNVLSEAAKDKNPKAFWNFLKTDRKAIWWKWVLRPITETEVSYAIKNFKSGKPPVVDGLNVQLFKPCSEYIGPYLANLFNFYFEHVSSLQSGLQAYAQFIKKEIRTTQIIFEVLVFCLKWAKCLPSF